MDKTEKKGNILVFSIAYYPFWGGAEIALKEISQRLEDYSFDLITLNINGQEKAEETIGNIKVYRISCSKIFFPFKAFLKARSLKKDYFVVWSIMANYAGFASLFYKLFKPNVNFLLTLQEGDPISYIKKKVFFVWPLFKMIFKRADYIQAISNYLADFGKEMGASCPLEVIPNGVDRKFFATEENFLKKNYHRQSFRQDLGINHDDIVLITTSRLVVKNGISDIIDSLKNLPKNVKLLILGTGQLESELKDKADSINNFSDSNRVYMLGFVPQDNIPEYLWSSDIFIRPSISEGLGNSFLEAMASGIPVIATPVGGIVDFLRDGETGLFCDVQNPNSIALKVEKLIKDKESRDFIVDSASKMVSERFDWDKISIKFDKIFSDLMLKKH